MDLALHLGMTEAGLRRAMTEQELQRWGLYAERRMLPMRRIELLLAQISLVVAQALGGAKNASLKEFLFDPAPLRPSLATEPDDDDEVPDADDIAEFFGGVVVRSKTKKD